MLAQPTQKRVLPLRGSGRNHTGVVGLLVDFCNSEIVAFDDISRRFRYSLAAGGGERRLLALINRMKTFGQVLREAQKKAGVTHLRQPKRQATEGAHTGR